MLIPIAVFLPHQNRDLMRPQQYLIHRIFRTSSLLLKPTGFDFVTTGEYHVEKRRHNPHGGSQMAARVSSDAVVAEPIVPRRQGVIFAVLPSSSMGSVAFVSIPNFRQPASVPILSQQGAVHRNLPTKALRSGRYLLV